MTPPLDLKKPPEISGLNDRFFFKVNDNNRTRDFGEVFTPLYFAKAMLSLPPSNMWSDHTSKIVEPTCGDGVFIVAAVNKRYLSLLGVDASSTAKSLEIKIRCHAMALSLNSIFGFDLLADNIESCRANLLRLVLFEIPEAKSMASDDDFSRRFLAYSCSVIPHQIRKKNTVATPIDHKSLVSFEELPRDRRQNACLNNFHFFSSYLSGAPHRGGAVFVRAALPRREQA